MRYDVNGQLLQHLCWAFGKNSEQLCQIVDSLDRLPKQAFAELLDIYRLHAGSRSSCSVEPLFAAHSLRYFPSTDFACQLDGTELSESCSMTHAFCLRAMSQAVHDDIFRPLFPCDRAKQY